MRLWSLHPKHLDAKGLVALWREGLLAQKVLAGRTRGYRHHPQLERFRQTTNPMKAIGAYLHHVAVEAQRRGYRFDAGKIMRKPTAKHSKMRVCRGQLAYEYQHLQAKLKKRDPQRFQESLKLKSPKPHPLFRVAPGGVEHWERF